LTPNISSIDAMESADWCIRLDEVSNPLGNWLFVSKEAPLDFGWKVSKDGPREWFGGGSEELLLGP